MGEQLSPDDSPSSDPETPKVTVGDALRVWTRARDAGVVPNESSSGTERSRGVLFIDRKNTGISVLMEAIFSDLVSRRAPKMHIFCHSAGTSVDGGGFQSPDPLFVEALQFKRNIDISSHSSCKLTLADLESFDLVVCCGLFSSFHSFHRILFLQMLYFPMSLTLKPLLFSLHFDIVDESIRSQALFMTSDPGDAINEEVESKFVCISNYASQDRLRKIQYKDGIYSKDKLNFVMSGLIDACKGLLDSLIDIPSPDSKM